MRDAPKLNTMQTKGDRVFDAALEWHDAVESRRRAIKAMRRNRCEFYVPANSVDGWSGGEPRCFMPGHGSGFLHPEIDPDDACEPCKRKAKAYGELLAARKLLKSASGKLERAVKS